MLKSKRILVVVAHPDDEILGVGGAINKFAKLEGTRIRVVILGEGITSRSKDRDTKKWEAQLSTHKRNIVQAKEKLGYESVGVYDFPDNRFDSVDLLDLIKVVEAVGYKLINLRTPLHGFNCQGDWRKDSK